MGERYITAIDLGTSKIALAVAIIEGDSIRVIYSKETPSDGVRYSRVVNPARAGEAIKNALSLVEDELGFRPTQVVAGYPKYEVSLKNGCYSTPRSENVCVTADDIRNLKNMAMDSYADASKDEAEVLLGAVAQSFNCGKEEFQILENDVIGMTTNELGANFKLFVGKTKHVNDMDLAFSRAGDVDVVRRYFTPEATAKAVLYESEMENGVALIDMGAGITSVSIYTGGILRHYAAVPFGGRSITMDIKSICGIPERLAENIKMAYGACMPDRLQNLGDKTLVIETDKALPSMQLSVHYLSEIITARETEIINAVLYEIQESGFADNLRSVVLTGGGADLTNISALFKELSGYSVRIGGAKRERFIGYVDSGTGGTAVAGMLLMAKGEEYVNCFPEAAISENETDNENGGPEDIGDGTDGGDTVFTPVEQGDGRGRRKKKERRERKPVEEKPIEEKKPDENEQADPQRTGGWSFVENLFENLFNEGV